VEFQDVVLRRRMVRAYEPGRPVPAEVRDLLLANALHAPSAGFSQGWAFLVLEDGADRDRFWELLTEPGEEPDSWLVGMRTAPLLIVALSNKSAYLARYAETDKGWTDRDEARWPVPYWDIDTGMASLLMLLTAVDAGLGACFFGVPPEETDRFRTGFGVPAEYTPVGVVSVGYRAPDRPSPSLRRGRRPVADVAHFGRW
jgi:nitroreductase